MYEEFFRSSFIYTSGSDVVFWVSRLTLREPTWVFLVFSFKELFRISEICWFASGGHYVLNCSFVQISCSLHWLSLYCSYLLLQQEVTTVFPFKSCFSYSSLRNSETADCILNTRSLLQFRIVVEEFRAKRSIGANLLSFAEPHSSSYLLSVSSSATFQCKTAGSVCVCEVSVQVLPSMYSVQLKPRTQFTFCCCLGQVAEGSWARERRAEREIKFSPLIKTETWFQSGGAEHFSPRLYLGQHGCKVTFSNTTHRYVRGCLISILNEKNKFLDEWSAHQLCSAKSINTDSYMLMNVQWSYKGEAPGWQMMLYVGESTKSQDDKWINHLNVWYLLLNNLFWWTRWSEISNRNKTWAILGFETLAC